MTKDSQVPSCRKGKGRARVLSRGKPLAGKNIRLEQKSHAFLFGCNAFDLIDRHEAGETTITSPQKKVFTEQFSEVFNFATLPFYWDEFEPREGSPQTNQLKKAATELHAAGLRIKGHPLCWHTLCPSWLLPYPEDIILSFLLDRIRREIRNFHGLIDDWDVINETVIMPEFQKYPNAITKLCRQLGRPELIRQVFAAARSESQTSTLILNDFDTSRDYERVIEQCLQDGVEIDVIGIQSHMHQGFWGKEKLLEVLDRFARFGKPIHFSELSILSGDTFVPRELDDLNDYSANEWPSTAKGERRQAEEVYETYSTLFGHPAVEAITWWDFADGNWLNAPSGLFRKDRSPKPAFETLRKLVREVWWTPSQTTTTDANGEFEFHGTFGQYEATIEGKTVALNFPRHSSRITSIEIPQNDYVTK